MGRIRPATRPGARTGSRPPSSRTGCGCSSGGAPASRRASRIRRPARARRVPRCPREPRRRSWSSSFPEPHGGGMKARKRVRVIPRPCAATAGPWQHAPVDRRPAVGIAVLAFSFGCRSAPPPQYPGSLIAVTVRLWPMLPRAGHVTASADTGGAALTLRTGLAPAELTGSIPVRPGAHTIAIEAFDGAGIRIGAASFSLTSDRGFPALLDATVLLADMQQAREGRPILGEIVAPRSSVVQGDRMLLQARTADPPAAVASAWSAVPPGCGAFSGPGALSTTFTAIAAGPCTVALTAAADGKRDRRAVTLIVRSRGRSYQYPLSVAPGGRHLVDQRGTPPARTTWSRRGPSICSQATTSTSIRTRERSHSPKRGGGRCSPAARASSGAIRSCG